MSGPNDEKSILADTLLGEEAAHQSGSPVAEQEKH